MVLPDSVRVPKLKVPVGEVVIAPVVLAFRFMPYENVPRLRSVDPLLSRTLLTAPVVRDPLALIMCTSLEPIKFAVAVKPFPWLKEMTKLFAVIEPPEDSLMTLAAVLSEPDV